MSNSIYLEEQAPGVQKIYHSIFLKVLNSILETTEATVDFNVARFLRVFIYHLLFFYFGFLTVPFILIFDSLGLASNMGFWFKTSIGGSLKLQVICWLMVVYMYVMWILNYLELGEFDFIESGPYLKGIYFEQFLFLSLHLLIRSFIIAVRYGSCSDLRYSLLQTES